MRKTLNVFETFSGIGAQHKALRNILEDRERVERYGLKNKDFKAVGTSEWYMDAIVAYDAIHHGSQETFNGHEKLERTQMLEFLEGFTLSKDSKNPYPVKNLRRLSDEKIKQLYIAMKRNKNFGSITEIKAEDLPKIDLLTYSFPCQDLSAVGGKKGIKKTNQKDKNTATRSGLLWEVERLLFELKELNKLPKFLVMENVKSLLNKTHLDDWLDFDRTLQELGYKNTTTILNATDFGIPQARERVFVISELGGTTNINVDKPGKMKTNMGEFLELDNDDYLPERMDCIPNDTPVRRKIWMDNRQIEHDTGCFHTLTTKADRNPNCGNFAFPNTEKQRLKDGSEIPKSQFRFITPREALKLMGFDNEDFERLRTHTPIPRDEIYKLAGNSIVVKVLEGIFAELLKRH